MSNLRIFFDKITKYKDVSFDDIFDIEIVENIIHDLCLVSRLKASNDTSTSIINSETIGTITVQDIIIKYSLIVDKVFDVSTFKYTDDVINSVETDENILKATIDLISLLMAGNQMVLTSRHNFE